MYAVITSPRYIIVNKTDVNASLIALGPAGETNIKQTRQLVYNGKHSIQCYGAEEWERTPAGRGTYIRLGWGVLRS